MLAIFEGRRPVTPSYLKFEVSNETVNRIRASATASEASAAFDLYVRDRLSRITYQDPDDIADGVRLCSTIELWNEVATRYGSSPQMKSVVAKSLKTQLSLIVRRRNQIAHEGDLQPPPLREPWPINQADLHYVAGQIEGLVKAIDAVV
jgi:hypothetical protein